LEQVWAVGGFVDGDTKSVVVVAVWFLGFLSLGPRKGSLDTGEEALALDVFAATISTLYPSSVAQVDLLQDDIFKVTIGLVAKGKDELEVLPADGH
jgi:hypothetical protein